MKAEEIQALYPKDTLTSLQRLAVEYINTCTAELKQYGIFIRSAEELEFITHDDRNKPVYEGIRIPEFKKFLQKDLFPHLEEFSYENPEIQMPDIQYELKIADTADIHHFNRPDLYDPVAVAAATNHAKQTSIRQALLETTCLTRPSQIVRATFAPRPFYNSPYHYENEFTSALHVNVSPFDAQGNNLFADAPALFEECGRALAMVQKKAGITMLPSPESLLRIGANLSAPGGIGIGNDEKLNQENLKNISVNFRRNSTGLKYLNKTRLENRLPGADADPLVAMAVTLAAYMQPLKDYAQGIKRSPTRYSPEAIPTNHKELARTFAKSREMETLLGKKFYSALLKEYGPSASR